MKFIKSVVVLMVLCGSQSSDGEKLNCVFKDVDFAHLSSLYSCEVTSLDTPHNNVTIDGHSGVHKINEKDNVVRAIYIHDKNTKFIPANLGSLFKLTAFLIESSQLIEIKSKDFHGMQDLEYISLWHNKLTSVPSNVFATLTKLRILFLSANQIQELSNGIFSNNVNLETIHLYSNKIKFIGSELFNGLTKLNKLNLIDNICISKDNTGATEILQLKKEIKIKCNNPNEVPATTNQNPTEMQQQIKNLEKQLTESNNELIKAREEQQKDRSELLKLRTVSSEAKNEHQKERIQLNCEFGIMHFAFIGYLYVCEATTLVNPHNNLFIEGYSGVHNSNKNDNDVKVIHIQNTSTKFIPTNLGSLSDLTAFVIISSQLIKINAKDFHGMHNLEFLNLFGNSLTSVPSDVFATLTQLRIISLSYNQIEELSIGVFSNNVNLEQIYLRNNKIKYIGLGLFDQLSKLNKLNLIDNICISKNNTGAIEILQLKEEVKLKCKNSNEATTSTTTKNPLEIKIFEMQETITKLEKETDDLNAELSKARNEQQRERTEMVNIINERDELKMEHFKCETKTQELEAKRQELENKTQELEVKTQELIVKLSKCEANQQNLENKIANSSKFNSFNINCDFVDISKAYTCVTRDLFIYYKDMELNEVTGTHLMSNKNINVTELIIANSSVLFWANDIFKAFPTLQTLEIHNAQLKELSKGDFYSATKVTVLKVQENEMKFLGDNVFEGAEEHLTKIYMNSNQIEKVSSGTFHGLKHLKLLSLKDNLITELKLGSFKDVVMLEN